MPEGKFDKYYNEEDGSFLGSMTTLRAQFGNPIDALLYAEIFSPKLIEVDGSIILEDNVFDAAASFLSAKADSKKSLVDLEEGFNFVEIAYLFSSTPESVDELEFQLAEQMAICWRGKLKLLYPDRSFVVAVFGPAETGSVVGIGFHEIR